MNAQSGTPPRKATWTIVGLLLILSGGGMRAAELEKKTADAFDRYVAESERLMATTETDPARFLWLDRLPDPKRQATLELLRRGEVAIDRQETRVGGKKVDAPGGMIHHWVGVAFIPGGTTDAAVRLLQDYDHHGDIYKPAMPRAKTLSRSGDTYHVAMRFFMKKVLTVVMNTELEAKFRRPSPGRAVIHVISTKVAEVEDPDTPQEKELPVGEGGGYMWRLNTYWRIAEADGGVYVQCESISLSRSIPFGFGWLIGPFVTSIPRESLDFVLKATRRTLVASPTYQTGSTGVGSSYQISNS